MPYFAKVTLLILVSAVSSLFVRHRLEQPSYAPAGPARVTMVTTGNPSNPDGAHYRGAPDVPITLVEYGDYACPPCAAYNTVINEVLQKYGDKIRLEYRHFPLTVPHPNALPASLAAEAAGRQGRYWEMHDLLFSSQQRWKNAANPEGEFAGLAESLGLDGKRFIEAFRSKELEERVRKDMRAGQELHVSAVPAFVINGRVIPEMLPTLERFKALIDAETAKRN